MNDFFGYSREVKPNGQITSSEFATLYMGGKMDLVQNVTAQYGQSVNAKFEVGSPTLYWVTGQPQGAVNFGRLVGRGGFLSRFNELKESCGKIVKLRLGLDGTGGCTAAQNTNGGTINFDGGVAESIQIQFSAGTLEVSEGASIKVASMSVG